MAKKAVVKKKPAKRDIYIAKAPIRRLMKAEGAILVAAEALDKLIGFLESSAADITKEAIRLTKAAKRKRITALDIRNATR
jgi:histone H3/H4